MGTVGMVLESDTGYMLAFGTKSMLLWAVTHHISRESCCTASEFLNRFAVRLSEVSDA